MRGPSCGFANAEGMHFSARLSEDVLLPISAPQGHQRHQPEQHPVQTAPPPAAPRTSEAERRQLMVLFCDLVDPTALASQPDLEEWREVVRAHQTVCAKVIARIERHIAEHLSDGLKEIVYREGMNYGREDVCLCWRGSQWTVSQGGQCRSVASVDQRHAALAPGTGHRCRPI